MTKRNISEAISCINDRYVEEVINFTTEKEIVKMKIIKNKESIIKKIMAAAACICICILSAIGVWKSEIFAEPSLSTTDSLTLTVTDGTQTTLPTIQNNVIEPSNQTENTTPSVTETEPRTGGEVEAETTQGDLAGDGGNYGIVPSKQKPELIGTAFTEDEIENYIEKNKESLLSVIQIEYENDFHIESVSVYKKGYCHVALGEENTLSRNYITLPILVNGKIYANVTLIKAAENDIVETISIGGKAWKNYNKVIFDNPHKDVIFAYLPGGWGEIMILPDNTAVNPVDGKLQDPISDLNPDVNWYTLLKTEYNTVNAGELLSEENLVIIL